MKDNQQINPVVAADGMSIEFELRGLPSLKFDLRKVSEINRNRAAAVGFADVRIVNAAAISRNAPDGSVRSAAEMLKLKREKMEALIQHYESGTTEWRVKRASGGTTRDTSGITLQAMQRVWPDKDCEALAGQLEQKRGISRREAYAEFAKTKQVAEAIAAIKAERATVDSDDLLAEMEDDAE